MRESDNPRSRPRAGPARWIVFGLGLLSAPVVLGLLFLALATPASASGICYSLGLVLVWSWLVCAPWRWRRARLLPLTGLGVLLATAAFRLVVAGAPGGPDAPVPSGVDQRAQSEPSPQGGRFSMQVAPGLQGGRFVDRLVAERDVALVGLMSLPGFGWIEAEEAEGAAEAFERIYDEMEQAYGSYPSPFAATWLGMQAADAFDLIVIEPPADAPRTDRGVLFLHGFAGNFAFECHLAARAAGGLGMVTYCPSTGPAGAWWRGRGPAIARRTLALMRQAGIRRVSLAGLSNGGVGASLLARSLRAELTDLVLLFGLSPEASPVPGLATLLIQARQDARMPARLARRYAAGKAGVRLVEIDGDHFAMAKRADEVRDVLFTWWAERR